MMLSMLFLLFLFVPFVAADNWDDFTNNLATDLAPLITLFGERLTKQFLSESISILDNVIFALSPLGVLTAVVSVIRICGGSSIRAFVGRAQEGPAEAEIELLPCISESTAELFNEGGITRVFGRPQIVEIVAWEDIDPKNGEKSVKIGTLREALREGAWTCRGEGLPDALSELDIPNLSLNKGIKRRDQFWFYFAAILGVALQIATIGFAVITVFIFPQTFKKDDKAAAPYAFPFYILGTTLLFFGMFFCAFIMERSSKEYSLQPEKASKIYWLQPGDQKVGDQVFSAFLAVNEGPESATTTDLSYIKSIRDRGFGGKYFEIYSTLASTLLGFIFQFVGLRGLHASVILAQLGSTFLMSIIRTTLRTERMAPGENKMGEQQRKLTSYKHQELDYFAFYLEKTESFSLLSLPDRPAAVPLPRFAPHVQDLSVKKLIQTRTKLAMITSNSAQSLNVSWDDMPIRQMARALADTIEQTMDLLSSWGVDLGETFKFRLGFECKNIEPNSVPQSPGTYDIGLMRCGDALRWRMELAELEAILGLWTWSIYKLDNDWQNSRLCRLIGLSEDEAKKEETYLLYHKWIFRQTEARLVPSGLIDDKRRLFCLESKQNVSGSDTFVVSTDNTVDKMAAQDIYVQFLREAFTNMKELDGQVDVVPGPHNSFLASNTRIDDLVRSFESCNLGSREDALLCIVPVLRKGGLLPDLAADSPKVRVRREQLIQREEWENVFSMLRWLCQRSQGSEFERSVYELAFLCRRALLANKRSVQKQGFNQICELLKSDLRDDFLAAQKSILPSGWTKSQYRMDWWRSFCAQLGWLAWNISENVPDTKFTQSGLSSLQVMKTLKSYNDAGQNAEGVQRGMLSLQNWLTRHNLDMEQSEYDDDDAQAFDWAIRNNQYTLLYFLLLRWMELSEHFPALIQMAYSFAAKNRSDWALRVLVRYEADINTLNPRQHSALIERIAAGDWTGVSGLLNNGAEPNGSDEGYRLRPLLIAIESGNAGIVELLLQKGATVDVLDKSGLSVMWWASRSGRFDVVDLLLHYGAELDPVGPDGITPLMSVASNEELAMLAFLIDKGANINARDGEGQTALISAAKHGVVSVVQLLVEKGADVNLREEEGLTALDMARKRGHQPVVDILEPLMHSNVV
ncbi:hypothetical protein N7522_004290 [Penicillium canescens]|nr:hypothetical protein N7522_004290 [Penicillium canescens]